MNRNTKGIIKLSITLSLAVILGSTKSAYARPLIDGGGYVPRPPYNPPTRTTTTTTTTTTRPSIREQKEERIEREIRRSSPPPAPSTPPPAPQVQQETTSTSRPQICGASDQRLDNSHTDVLGYDCGPSGTYTPKTTTTSSSTGGSTTPTNTAGDRCGGTTGVRCGDEPNWDNYYPNGTTEYNALVGTNSQGTGWWTPGNTSNSGYTVRKTDGSSCDNGAQSGYQCMEITNPNGSSGGFIYVNDTRYEQMERAAGNSGYGSNYSYTLTTTSFECSGCTCYDSGWRDCSTPKAPAWRASGREDPPVLPPPGCVNTTPAKPVLTNPADDGSVNPNEPATLTWSLSGWGNNCAGNNNRYFLTVVPSDGSPIQVILTTGSYSIDVSPGQSFTWYVVASNGIYSRSSDVQSFMAANISDLSGYIWDSSAVSSCSASRAVREIQPEELSDTVGVSVGSISGTWDPDTFDTYSYEASGVNFGSGQILCANVPEPADGPNFRYILECVNNSNTNIISGSCASVDVDAANETFDLGYRLASTGWFHSIGGDVFGGCSVDNCAASVSVGIPDAGDILGGFTNKLISDVGTLFSNSGLSVSNDDYSEDDDRHLQNISSDEFFPSSFSFSVPEEAASVSDCNGMFGGDLDGNSSYSASRSCVQDGLDNLSGSYSLGSDGIAVVFVEGDGSSLVFDKNFQSSNSDQRVMFVVEGSVEITSDIGEAAPTTSTSANIQASIVAEESITFQSVGAGSEDTTAIVEGPLVTKDGAIVFGRDRVLNNGYPAEVVIYNPIYLTALSDNPVSGVAAIDISWTLQQ